MTTELQRGISMHLHEQFKVLKDCTLDSCHISGELPMETLDRVLEEADINMQIKINKLKSRIEVFKNELN